jgi:hypothetical protein
MRRGARVRDIALTSPFPIVAAAAVGLGTLAIAVAPALGYDEGPDDHYAGNPPNYENCTVCHDSYPVSSGDGGVAILNLPSSFVPGATYDLLVQVYDPGQQRWGFELTVLGPSNEQAGDLVVVDAVETQLSDNPGTDADFLKHTFYGTHEGTSGPTAWPFRWVAPNLPSATFYVAGNAADYSTDPAGDYIYLSQAQLTQTPTATDASSWGRIKAIYRSQ